MICKAKFITNKEEEGKKKKKITKETESGGQ